MMTILSLAHLGLGANRVRTVVRISLVISIHRELQLPFLLAMTRFQLAARHGPRVLLPGLAIPSPRLRHSRECRYNCRR